MGERRVGPTFEELSYQVRVRLRECIVLGEEKGRRPLKEQAALVSQFFEEGQARGLTPKEIAKLLLMPLVSELRRDM